MDKCVQNIVGLNLVDYCIQLYTIVGFCIDFSRPWPIVGYTLATIQYLAREYTEYIGLTIVQISNVSIAYV